MRIINEPADSKETMIKIINFLYNIYEVQRTISHQLVVGDAKTFEVLRKLKEEYGSDQDWLIHFPGDWHILKKFSQSFSNCLAMQVFVLLYERLVSRKAD